jgi:prepilin-type N-terminal cleavage/methylation domain-containing protein
MRGVGRSSVKGHVRGARSAHASRGLTILELLIAIVIFAVAMLALGAALLGDFAGIRREGQITISNQVAVTVLEDLRKQIRLDRSSIRAFDNGSTGTRVTPVQGANYVGTFAVTPRRVDSGESLVAPGGLVPHVFEVTFSIAVDGVTRTYRTLVARNP